MVVMKTDCESGVNRMDAIGPLPTGGKTSVRRPRVVSLICTEISEPDTATHRPSGLVAISTTTRGLPGRTRSRAGSGRSGIGQAGVRRPTGWAALNARAAAPKSGSSQSRLTRVAAWACAGSVGSSRYAFCSIRVRSRAARGSRANARSALIAATPCNRRRAVTHRRSMASVFSSTLARSPVGSSPTLARCRCSAR